MVNQVVEHPRIMEQVAPLKAIQPEMLHLQITERCNLACPKCYIPELNTTPAHLELSPDSLRTQCFEPAARLGYSKLVITGGEPYLSKQFYDIISAARPFFGEIFVGTSGYFLNDEHCHRTIDVGIDYVQVSLDAVERELLRKLTGIRRVDKLWDNCERFLRIRDERQSSSKLVVAVVIGPENAHEVINVLQHCEAIGVDSITVQAYHEYDVIYRKTRIDWPEPMQFDDAFLQHVHQIIDYVLTSKQHHPTLYPHSEIYFRNLIRFFEDRGGLDIPCSSDNFLFVDSRGYIRGCLFSEPLGHISDGLDSYLKSKEFQAFRTFLSNCHLCTHGCAYRPPMDA